MISAADRVSLDIESRARQSCGISNQAIYDMVVAAMANRSAFGGTLVDVGCGRGGLWTLVKNKFDRCIATDAIRYGGLASDVEFVAADFNKAPIAIADGIGDAVVAVETVEHLENPRALMRELVRIVRPGGWIFMTTPNQLSFVSLLNLIFRKRFHNFQEVHYPAHITALLEVDLQRIAAEQNLAHPAIEYSMSSRIPFTSMRTPLAICRLFPRAFSENLLMAAQRPPAE
jgi:2-polyprenyl-3-methyl-5-hydroxy-6-metoxy-1,4-benzoquinol methylase